jgi:hypothetical protein
VHGRGSDGDVAEARHHGGEVVSAVEALFEFGEVAGYMLVVDGPVMPVMALLMFPRVVLTHLNAGARVALRPDPVMIG